MKLSGSIAIASIFLAAAQPCLAAEDLRPDTASYQRSAAFAGFRARLPLGQKEAQPSARLMLGSMHKAHLDSALSSGAAAQVGGIELGLTSKAKLDLHVAGQSASTLKNRLGLQGSTNTWLIVGGVALAAAAALLIFSGDGSSACIPEDPDCS